MKITGEKDGPEIRAALSYIPVMLLPLAGFL